VRCREKALKKMGEMGMRIVWCEIARVSDWHLSFRHFLRTCGGRWLIRTERRRAMSVSDKPKKRLEQKRGEMRE